MEKKIKKYVVCFKHKSTNEVKYFAMLGKAKDLVNYSHLKEGASCFTETTGIKVSLNVEDVSPQALISVVPTVLYITL